MQSSGQKSLRDYFASPVSKTGFSTCSTSGSKRTLPENEVEPLSSTPAKKKLPPSKMVIVVDSDADEDAENVFERSKKYRSPNVFQSQSEKSGKQGQGQHSASLSSRKKVTRSRMGRWSCGACTYSNHAFMSYCEMCSTKKDSPLKCNSAQSLDHSGPDTGRVTNTCSVEVSEPSSPTTCLSSTTLENKTPNFSPQSDINERLTMSQTDIFSDSAASVYDTSLLKTLGINSGQLPDANCESNSTAEQENLTNDVLYDASGLVSSMDFENSTIHELLQFSCSRNSSRIYVFDEVCGHLLRPAYLVCYSFC